jgi:hypothetical protein
MSFDLERFLLSFIAVLLLVILVVLSATIYRRFAALRRYRALDRNRERFGREIAEGIDSGKPLAAFLPYAFPPLSSRWHAVEDVLSVLRSEPGHEAAAAALFESLGYRAHYEGRLGHRNPIEKSSAAEKLGRMGGPESAGKLVPLLDEPNGEIVSVTVRALSKLGTAEALEAVLGRLPLLFARSLVSRKSIDSSLRNFGAAAAPGLVRHGELYEDPVSKASVLEVLAGFGLPEALPFALRCLDHGDAEVRARALKVVGSAGVGLPPAEKDRILPLLSDPVWFVRLQAAKTAGLVGHAAAAPLLAKRLADENWQVRNAAATAIVRSCDDAAAIFLRTLGATDRYAKESVCEEIEKTGFVYRLIDRLGSPGGEGFEESREILKVMISLGYGSPMEEYVASGGDDRVRRDLSRLLEGGAA